jgi:hypothetical protein
MRVLLLTAVSVLALNACILIPVDTGGGKSGAASSVVCHKGKKTMELPREAVQAHLDHGDHMGPC